MKGSPSAPTTTTRFVFNKLPALRVAIPNLAQERVERAAESFRTQLRAALQSSRSGLGSDTKALVESLSIQTPFGSDYDERLRAAAAAYLGNPSQWRELVREHVSKDAYTIEHFNARVSPDEPLTVSSDEAIARVSTMLAWGFWFEFGHQNELTGQYEHRPWMEPEAATFGREYEKFFHGLLDGVIT